MARVVDDTASGSANTVSASGKDTLCFDKFCAAFRGSHSKRACTLLIRVSALRRALAAAELQAVLDLVAPVAEHFGNIHQRLGEIRGELAESLHLVTQNVSTEAFAFLAVLFEVLQHAPDGHRSQP